VRGIRIGLDVSWFIVFGLLTWVLAMMYYPAEFPHWSAGWYWGMGAVTTALLFVSVLLHELGHSFVAQHYGIPVRNITLFIFGGVSQIAGEPPRASAEFLIAIAGPAVSLVLAAVFGALSVAWTDFPPARAIFFYLALINGLLFAFNLIPGFPLDGGRVFRAAIWGATHNFQRATSIAARVGQVFGLVFIAVGIWLLFTVNFWSGIWLAFIGWFLESAASAQVQQLQLKRLLTGHKVAEAMSTACPDIPPELTVRELVDTQVRPLGRRCFVVRRDGQALGLLTLQRLKQAPKAEWHQTTVESVMQPLASTKYTPPDAELWSALEQMERDGVNQLAVVAEGQLVGMLSRDDVINRMRTLQEIGD
jgi:Zn-dependent protease/CBS domain-containing protein